MPLFLFYGTSMKKYLFFTLAFCTLALTLKAQFIYDYNILRSNDKKIIEIYYTMPTNALLLNDPGVKYLLIGLFDNTSLIENRIYELGNSEKGSLNIDQFNFIGSEKAYTIKYVTLDAAKKKISTIDSSIIAVSNSTLNKNSNIQLAYSIKKSDDPSSQFYKNGLEIKPNPTSYYDQLSSKLYYYMEVYADPNQIKDSIVIEIELKDNNSVSVLNSRQVKKSGNPIVIVGGYDISSLPNGTYRLGISERIGNQMVNQLASKKVFINTGSNTQAPLLAKDQLAIVISSLSAQELDELFNQLAYISNDQERRIYKALLTLNDKQKFVEKFFSLRANEDYDAFAFYSRYLELIETANQQYSTNFKKGWKTDRGRIFLIYGEPSHIEKAYSSNDTKPYETWTYNNVEGGVEFIFGDLSENGDYILMHSTKRGEISDKNWIQRLQINLR